MESLKSCCCLPKPWVSELTDYWLDQLGLEHKVIHERISVISKVAQATHAAEFVMPTMPRSGRIHPKIQKKRGPAPRVPFAQLSKFESSSEDDEVDDEDGSSEQESSVADDSSSEQGFSDGMDL